MISIRKASWFLLILVAFTLSACRVVVETKVNDDGSGELRSSVVFSAEEKKNFESAPNNSGKSICDNLKGAPADATFLQEARGEETYCTTVRSFDTVHELRDFYARMANVTVNELSLGLGKFVFDVQVDLTPKNGNEAAPQEWRLTIPGEVGDNNADGIEGQTLTWNIQPGQVRVLHAESAVGLNTITLASIGAIILLLGIAVGVIAARGFANRKRSA